MQRWSSREELVHKVVMLHKQGLAVRAIQRTLHVARNTVRKILAAHAQARRTESNALPKKPTRAPRATMVTPWAPRVAQLLCKYVDITAQRVFETLRDEGYTGGYTAIKDHVREVRPRAPITPSLPTPVYGPGVMSEADWTPTVVRWMSGKKATLQIHGYVLNVSRRKAFLAYERSDMHALMAAHTASFARFKGLAANTKYDCQKTVVLYWEGSKPVYNPRFLAFATYYGFRPVACRPRKPNDKPKVERSFDEYQRSFLNGREFRDLEDFRVQLSAWQDKICDVRLHKTLKRSSLALFAEEAPYLQPLPVHAYDTARVVYRLCSIDGFVAWDGNRYAVPYDVIYDVLPLRVTEHELFVYAPDLRLLVRHELAPRSAGAVINPPGVHALVDRRGADLELLRATFLDLGDEDLAFFTGLERLGARQASYQARQILLLRERYSSDALLLALQHAQGFGAFEHRSVARILESRHPQRTLAEYVTEDAVRRAERALGRAETRGRDLDEYDRLPLLGTPACKEISWPKTKTPPTLPSCSNDSDDTSNCSD